MNYLKNHKGSVFCIVILLIIFFVFKGWGNRKYSYDNQAAKIMAVLKDPTQDLSPYVVSKNPNIKPTRENLKPLQKYFQKHPGEMKKIFSNNIDLNDIDDEKLKAMSDLLSIDPEGHYLLFFKKYKLDVGTVKPEIKTNHSSSVLYVDGKRNKNFASDNYVKANPIFPGIHRLGVRAVVNKRGLSTSTTKDIWGSHPITGDVDAEEDYFTLNINTKTFLVEGAPDSKLYINNKEVGQLDSRGLLFMKEYPISDGTQLYAISKNGDKSNAINNLDAKMDQPMLGDPNHTDTMDMHTDNNSEVFKTNKEKLVVRLTWKNTITQLKAEDFLDKVFNSPKPKDFVNGSSNSSYSEIKKWKHKQSKSVMNSDIKISIQNVYPLGKYTGVKYVISMNNKKLAEYNNGSLVKSENRIMLKSMGKKQVVDNSTDIDLG